MNTIEKIHQEFDTAQDRLLNEATHILYKGKGIVSLAERLKSVGFNNVPIVEESKSIVKSEQEAEIIQYYKQNYPFLKFITENELDRICTKYKLVYAPVGRYIKNVPEKNLRDIENAQELKAIDIQEDKKYSFFKYDRSFYPFGAGRNWPSIVEIKKCKSILGTNRIERHFINECEASDYIKDLTGINIQYMVGSVKNVTEDKSGLFIAAPQSHFNTKGLNRIGLGFFSVFETEIKDPIVFRYVRGGIQVITKWGVEGEDPALVNPINN